MSGLFVSRLVGVCPRTIRLQLRQMYGLKTGTSVNSVPLTVSWNYGIQLIKNENGSKSQTVWKQPDLFRFCLCLSVNLYVFVPEAVEHQADEEDDEEMVCVPEHLEVGPADDLHGGGDDEDERQRDSHARQPGDGGEHYDGRVLQQSTA